MPELYNWLKRDGYALVAELLHTFPIPDEFNPATYCQIAPATSTTEEAINVTRGGVEQEVLFAIEQGHPGFMGGWVSSIALDGLLERLGAARRIPRSKRKGLLQSLGFEPHPGLPEEGLTTEMIPFPDAGRPRLFVRPGSKEYYLSGPGAIIHAYATAQAAKTTV
jgi:hypothetical protein